MTAFKPLLMRDMRNGDLFITSGRFRRAEMFFVLNTEWDGEFVVVKVISFLGDSLQFDTGMACMDDAFDQSALLVSRRPNAGVSYA